MSLTLYRKYRPKTFSDVEGQEHVVRTLQGAFRTGRIGHAYLFTGPRGTGKTTMARLLAKALNCANRKPEAGSRKSRFPHAEIEDPRFASESGLEAALVEPCNVCSSCTEISEGRSLDLIEIDAASNRGIDEIRNLKDSARVAATSSNYKVFIVDECHMLTPPAFNALLKTLEEPPAHVVFVLATTEPHKLPGTILSRVQRFDFRKINTSQIVKKLERVAHLEGITLEPEALQALATHASGSLRDAEVGLAKLVAYAGSSITALDTAEILGIVPLKVHENFLAALVEKRTQDALAQISDLHESGIDLEHFTKQFLSYLRLELIAAAGPTPGAIMTASSLIGNGPAPGVLVNIINAFIKARAEFKSSPIPQLPLELAVVELTGDHET